MCRITTRWILGSASMLSFALSVMASPWIALAQEEVSPEQMAMIRAAEEARIKAIEKVYGSVVAIYDEGRQGGGSGVLISPNGLALTNHHVIMGAGVSGYGGLADGKLYRWELLGTDPGGDLAVIQLKGRDDFPFASIGDSNFVRIGDFAMAMGNPFLLAEDHHPTVTLGIVSGIERYQYGSGKNELVYGNCIQVDSSINPGNSGGPLFNMAGEIIGINGRGSFAQRGRVNVGLGYAISSNQIKNFYPDLLATKLTEHGTLDAQFGMRSGKVVCETINLDSPVAELGLELGDQLLEFQHLPIRSANEFTNLISTMPEGWPVHLKIEKPSGQQREIWVRLLGLPYKPPEPPEENQETPEEQREQIERQQKLVELLRKQPGVPTRTDENAKIAAELWAEMVALHGSKFGLTSDNDVFQYTVGESVDGSSTLRLTLSGDGTFEFDRQTTSDSRKMGRNQEGYWIESSLGEKTSLSKAGARKYAEVLTGDFVTRVRQGLRESDRISLDAGDDCGGSICFRLRIEEADGDWWYLWLRTFDDESGPRLAPVKISPDADCDRYGLLLAPVDSSSQGVTRWRVVQGLGESVLETWNPRPPGAQ